MNSYWESSTYSRTVIENVCYYYSVLIYFLFLRRQNPAECSSPTLAMSSSTLPQTTGNPPANAGRLKRSVGRVDPLEEGTATHSGILAWRIPWTEEPGGLQSTGSQRVRHDWSDLVCMYLKPQLPISILDIPYWYFCPRTTAGLKHKDRILVLKGSTIYYSGKWLFWAEGNWEVKPSGMLWGPPRHKSLSYHLSVCREKAFRFLDLLWAPKGRFKQLLIRGIREYRKKQ